MKTEARNEIGDEVIIDLGIAGKITSAIISSVKFTDYGKVIYSVKIKPFENDDTETIIDNIDSYFIKTIYDGLLKH